MRSMYAGVSGLKVHQTKMDVIGNNISNVNTTGYKGSRVNFKTMLSQTIKGAQAPQNDRGGMNPQQIGLGVSIGSIDTNMEQGNLQSTGSGTDLAVQGNGFFVINDGQQNLYTRAGGMSLDESGNLVNSSTGFNLQGWMADDLGNINTNQTLEDIQIPMGKTMTGKNTDKATFGGNLDGRDAGGESRKATIDVFDSLGKKHTMGINFNSPSPTTVFDPGSNNIEITATDTSAGTDAEVLDKLNIEFVNPAAPGSPGSTTYDSASHTVTCLADPSDNLSDLQSEINSALDSDGGFSGNPISLDTLSGHALDIPSLHGVTNSLNTSNNWGWEVTDITEGSVVSGTGTGQVEFNADGTIKSGSISGSVQIDPKGGAASGQTIDLDFSNLTQSAANYSVDGINANGYEMGSLESFNIDNAGVINGTFSNGLSQSLGQIALASFSNPSGMTKNGDTLYAESQNSGMAQIGTAGNGGRGDISAGTLEMSNVDLSKQFTEMITTQRGFQANSKIISTTDQMLQELVNLKR